MKHVPFQSIYRPDFEVVEERQGNVSFYPHTEQLPLLLRALNLEFYGALPARIARVDHRADDFHKIVLKLAASMFCFALNPARSDQLQLFGLLNPERVTKLAIVQQITKTTRRGLCHRFRFYAGKDFFPEIYLSGKRVVFSDHVLQRFSTRVPNPVGEDLFSFLLSFFGSPIVAMPVGPGRAFILPYSGSILALTYKETEDEFFITTCLTMNELHSLDIDPLPRAFNLHYGPAFTRPKIRNWCPAKKVIEYFHSWERKVPLPPAKPPGRELKWSFVANWLKGHLLETGHGPGSRLSFVDNIPGPNALEIRPDQVEGQYDELETFKRILPEYDWDAIAAERDGNSFRPEWQGYRHPEEEVSQSQPAFDELNH